jgi:hypothetical protein
LFPHQEVRKSQDSPEPERKIPFMVVRAFAFSLLIAASLADSSGAHPAAFFFLLAAVPVIAIGGLILFGDLVEARELDGKIVAGAQATLHVIALALVIVVIGSGSGPLLEIQVPGLRVSALGACLGLFVVQALLGLIGRVLKAARRPAGLYVRAGEEFATAEHIGP